MLNVPFPEATRSSFERNGCPSTVLSGTFPRLVPPSFPPCPPLPVLYFSLCAAIIAPSTNESCCTLEMRAFFIILGVHLSSSTTSRLYPPFLPSSSMTSNINFTVYAEQKYAS